MTGSEKNTAVIVCFTAPYNGKLFISEVGSFRCIKHACAIINKTKTASGKRWLAMRHPLATGKYRPAHVVRKLDNFNVQEVVSTDPKLPTRGATHHSPLSHLTFDEQILHIFILFRQHLICVKKSLRLWIVSALNYVSRNKTTFGFVLLCYVTQVHSCNDVTSGKQQ